MAIKLSIYICRPMYDVIIYNTKARDLSNLPQMMPGQAWTCPNDLHYVMYFVTQATAYGYWVWL